MVSYGGEQSLDRYLALSARGIPFNVAHAVGNIVLALAAGPALVRMISRYRSRFEFTWRRRPAACRAAGDRGRRRRAARGLRARRPRWPAARGAGGGRLGKALARASAEPRWRLRASPGARPARRSRAGRCWGWRAPAATRSTYDGGGRSAIGYLRSQAADLRSTGDLERTILALEGAGVSPRRFGGRDLVAELRRRRSRERLVRGPGEPDGLRDPRAARGRRSALRRSDARPPGSAGPERRRRLGLSAARRERPGQHRRRAPGLAAAGGARRATVAERPTCAAPSAPTAASRWPTADRRTRSRPPGRSRAWSPPEPIPPPDATDAAPRLPGRAARQPTATTATRRRATRHPSGSPPRRCSRSTARHSRWPRYRAPRRVLDREAGPGGSAGRAAPSRRRRTDPRRRAGRDRQALRRSPGRARAAPARSQGRARCRRSAGAAAAPVAAATAGRRRAGHLRLRRRRASPLLTAALVGGFFWYRRRLPERPRRR